MDEHVDRPTQCEALGLLWNLKLGWKWRLWDCFVKYTDDFSMFYLFNLTVSFSVYGRLGTEVKEGHRVTSFITPS